MTIAPPKDHLELGDYVRYHHRACVARIPKPSPGGTGIFAGPAIERRWETVNKEGGSPPIVSWDEKSWLARMPIYVGRNKTIVVWPEKGSGYIMGLVRRGIGTSHSGYTTGWETPEWEPGYFEPEEWHWLYAVKCHLPGLDCIYVPLWAAQKDT